MIGGWAGILVFHKHNHIHQAVRGILYIVILCVQIGQKNEYSLPMNSDSSSHFSNATSCKIQYHMVYQQEQYHLIHFILYIVAFGLEIILHDTMFHVICDIGGWTGVLFFFNISEHIGKRVYIITLAPNDKNKICGYYMYDLSHNMLTTMTRRIEQVFWNFYHKYVVNCANIHFGWHTWHIGSSIYNRFLFVPDTFLVGIKFMFSGCLIRGNIELENVLYNWWFRLNLVYLPLRIACHHEYQKIHV
ncbi:hypothetical protein ACJX0J_008096, partial [Zea mays]